jgi:hypothetical protein
MSHAGETFFTSIGCMDGRVHQIITEYGQNRYGVKYADTITEAGIVGQIVKEDVDPKLLEAIKNKILISISKHLSKGIIVHGHVECAGNPIDDELHRKQTIEAAKIVKNMVGAMQIEVIPVFVVRDGDGWKVEEL